MVEPVIIGDATLYCGDCREILPNLTAVDHIITDPPYGEGTHAGHDKKSKRRADKASARTLGYSALSFDDVETLAGLFCEVSRGWVVWFTNFDLSQKIQLEMRSQSRTAFPALPYFHAGRSVRLAGDGPSSWTDWILVSRPARLSSWGTLRGGYVAGPGWSDKARMGGKPVHLMELVVADYSHFGDLVCDPFMGAGTTGIAAAKSGRKFTGIEIDPDAFDIACKRIEQAQQQASLFPVEPPQPSRKQEGLFGD